MLQDIDQYLWVFISHSTKDFDKVRIVRNALEEEGFRPILFYLKCISDDEEINSLLKREIDARNRFILCDSVNAQESKYVQSEVEYIRSKNRMYEIIDLNQIEIGAPDIQEHVTSLIKPFKRRTTVFLSYSRNDSTLANCIRDELLSAGFKVFDENNDIPSGVIINDFIANKIQCTLDNGYFIPIISNSACSSPFVSYEWKYALEIHPQRCLPVICETLQDIHYFHLQYVFRGMKIDVSQISSDTEKAQSIVKSLIDFDLKNNP